MATTQPSAKSSHPKKKLKKELVNKIESALPEMKTTLGEKKFHSRVKKAAKIIVHGLHTKDISNNNNKPENAIAPQPKKAKALKKAKTEVNPQ